MVCLTWSDHITSNFSEAVFHKFYLVRPWILCLIWSPVHNKGLRSKVKAKGQLFMKPYTALKMSECGVFLVSIFPHFDWIRIQYTYSKCGKIRTRKNSGFGYFSRSGNYDALWCDCRIHEINCIIKGSDLSSLWR